MIKGSHDKITCDRCEGWIMFSTPIKEEDKLEIMKIFAGNHQRCKNKRKND